MSKCNLCNNTDLIRMHQYGVNNHQKIEGQFNQPELLFDFLICKLCGSVKVDINTLEIKENKVIWTNMKLEGDNVK